MQNPINEKAAIDKLRVRADVCEKLEHEQGTSRRQELLKFLWKLTQPPEETDVSVSPAKAVNCRTERDFASAESMTVSRRPFD